MGLILVVVAAYDVTQRRHAILRNFPVIGHLRYLLESVGPELRQYIVTDNRRERPFDRDQRRWIYTSAKGINNNFGFGSDADLDTTSGHIIIDILDGHLGSRTAQEIFGYDPSWAWKATATSGQHQQGRL